MARTISAAALAKLTADHGTEPINIVEIQWVPAGPRDAYADRDIAGGVKGAIQELSGLDSVIQVSGGGQSSQISIVLNDTDGSLKQILDTQDIHKRPCWVYQWFDGIALSEKFLIFKGVISSPIVWNEGDRTVSFDIISKIEDVEVGFSIEEGDFPSPPEDLIGKPWPLCFGTCVNVPALRLGNPREGTLASGAGIVDPTLEARIIATRAICCPIIFYGFRATYNAFMSLIIVPIFGPDPACLLQNCQAVDALEFELEQQLEFQSDSFVVIDGEKFPQGTTITLNIDGAKFTGQFAGNVFTVESAVHPERDNLFIPPAVYGLNPCSMSGSVGTLTGGPAEFEATPTQLSILRQLAEEEGLFEGSSNCNIVIGGIGGGGPSTAGGLNNTEAVSLVEAGQQIASRLPSASFFWANPGAKVRLDGEEEIIYAANLLPSTIERVASKRQFPGGEVLVTVPEEYYEVRQVDYQGYQVMEIVFSTPLSRQEEGWNDDIYVTLTSSVGPNTVDILEWLIETYTVYGIDSTSFDAVRILIDNYPSHFPLLERKNILTLLEEIAFQARCAIWLKDDVFFIRYLAAVPTSVDTIEETDIDPNSLELYHSPTEDIVTKFVVEWKHDYAKDKPNKRIFRHNVVKYGTQERTDFFYIYNIEELIIKAATFWLIRLSNTWRKARFTTPLHKLNLEVFDGVTIDLPDICPTPVLVDVETASYDSESNTINFDVWTPLKSGTTVPYDFARPADIEQTALFPTEQERLDGFAGSGQGPSFATRPPENHPLSHTPGLWQGFNLACNGNPTEGPIGEGHCRSDHGNRHPSDRGDVKPGVKRSNDNQAPNNGGYGGSGRGTAAANDCCAIAKEALATAKKALDMAARATEPEAGELEDLPECEATGCTSRVNVFKTTVEQVSRNGAFHNDGCGIPTQGTPSLTQSYCFNSRNMAQQFFNDTKAQQDAQAATEVCVGQQIIVNANVGLAGTSATCPEPEDGLITGFTETGG